MLDQAINDYLLWMIARGYAQSSRDDVERVLKHFSAFVNSRNIPWESIFTFDTLRAFRKQTGLIKVYGIRGLSTYLFHQKRISQPIQRETHRLPQIYEKYLLYYEKVCQVCRPLILSARRVLTALDKYLQKRHIPLVTITIEQLDTFLVEYTANFAPGTCREYRCSLRGFLRYLYQEKEIKKDLASLLGCAPLYAEGIPPKFLRSHELKQLFRSLDTSSAKGIRTYALIYCAYTLGLRHKEISLMRLDDISFSRQELIIGERKAKNPIKLPLPETTIKAIAAYIIGVRPKSDERHLFLSLRAPYIPLSPSRVGKIITSAIEKANIPGSAYWLRHTYAQHLLESGASIFEIKEMLGHTRIKSSKQYLHIHTKLMREVIFDETL